MLGFRERRVRVKERGGSAQYENLKTHNNVNYIYIYSRYYHTEDDIVIFRKRNRNSKIYRLAYSVPI